jgi:CRISPR-associated protein Cas1
MKRLLNTVFITQEDVYLTLKGENLLVRKEEDVLGQIPLINIESIVAFSYLGISPALMGFCAQRDIAIAFLTPNGNFLARVIGKSRGNVLLRKKQYAVSADEDASALIARNFITGKVYNQKWVLERATRDYALRVDVDGFKRDSVMLTQTLKTVRSCEDLDALRGFEGQAAAVYFGRFNDLILQQKETFVFNERSRRPPLDEVNALLSFAYTLLTHDVASALETVGLDAYVGFLHRDRPGRVSLALDMVEELRPVYADRFVLSLINKKMITGNDFVQKESGAILLKDEARKTFLSTWQKRKQDILEHPYLQEKISWGLVPYVQALLLSRYLRNDIDEYPPFLWK